MVVGPEMSNVRGRKEGDMTPVSTAVMIILQVITKGISHLQEMDYDVV